MTYRQLNVQQTIDTLQTLKKRIGERFDGTSLEGVAGELCTIAGESRAKIDWIDRPHRGLRIAVFGVVLLALAAVWFGINEVVKSHTEKFTFADAVPLIESGINEIIFAGAALAFLFTLEVRVKRTRALRALHDLRAIAHVIDMHQLTKDPSQILNADAAHKVFAQTSLTPFLLTRYLDYCSEMLSLIGKLAALYAQSLPDPVVVAAVNDIETLTNGIEAADLAEDRHARRRCSRHCRIRRNLAKKSPNVSGSGHRRACSRIRQNSGGSLPKPEVWLRLVTPPTEVISELFLTDRVNVTLHRTHNNAVSGGRESLPPLSVVDVTTVTHDIYKVITERRFA